MIISLIAAMDENRLIGCGNKLPWHLPDDFKHFKAVTLGKPIIMGRKTFESIGKLLPGRKNIVLSRNNYQADGITSVTSIEQALHEVAADAEVMIIGGENIYQQMLAMADRMYITHVHAQFEGDAWFPVIDDKLWWVVSSHPHPADEKNQYAFTVTIYQRNR